MEFKKTGFSKSTPSVVEIEMRRVAEQSESVIQEALLVIAKDVAKQQLGIEDVHELQDLLKVLDDNFITINMNISRVDGKHYATFSVSVMVSALPLDDV